MSHEIVYIYLGENNTHALREIEYFEDLTRTDMDLVMKNSLNSIDRQHSKVCTHKVSYNPQFADTNHLNNLSVHLSHSEFDIVVFKMDSSRNLYINPIDDNTVKHRELNEAWLFLLECLPSHVRKRSYMVIDAVDFPLEPIYRLSDEMRHHYEKGHCISVTELVNSQILDNETEKWASYLLEQIELEKRENVLAINLARWVRIPKLPKDKKLTLEEISSEHLNQEPLDFEEYSSTVYINYGEQGFSDPSKINAFRKFSEEHYVHDLKGVFVDCDDSNHPIPSVDKLWVSFFEAQLKIEFQNQPSLLKLMHTISQQPISHLFVYSMRDFSEDPTTQESIKKYVTDHQVEIIELQRNGY